MSCPVIFRVCISLNTSRITIRVAAGTDYSNTLFASALDDQTIFLERLRPYPIPTIVRIINILINIRDIVLESGGFQWMICIFKLCNCTLEECLLLIDGRCYGLVGWKHNTNATIFILPKVPQPKLLPINRIGGKGSERARVTHRYIIDRNAAFIHYNSFSVLLL